MKKPGVQKSHETVLLRQWRQIRKAIKHYFWQKITAMKRLTLAKM
jgi:hypothetical protein